MKTALFFDEQTAQLVLTAESKWEETMLHMLKSNYPDFTFEGGFYDCAGGWIRMIQSHSFAAGDSAPSSLMIRMPKGDTGAGK